ncbi:hypothetical protein APED_06695 [Acanthopleuribacter pedis]
MFFFMCFMTMILPGKTLSLKTNDLYMIYGVVPYHDHLLIPHMGPRGNHFHSYDKEGNWTYVFGQSGEGPDGFSIALMPSFNNRLSQWLILDLYRNQLKTFDTEGRLIATKSIPSGLHFAQEGKAIGTERGYVFLADAYADQWLLVETDFDMNIQRKAHKVFDDRVPYLDSQSYKGFLLETEAGYVVLESLVSGWTVYDKMLKEVEQVKTMLPHWRTPDVEVISKLRLDDFRMERHFELHSEIKFAQVIDQTLVLGIRSPGRSDYTYAGFKLNGSRVGELFHTAQELVGSTDHEAIFSDSDAEHMEITLVPLHDLLKTQGQE